MIFQEFLEDILDKNKNLKIITGDETSCVVANLDRGRTFHITPSDDLKEITIKKITNCFLDNTNKDESFPIDELESFLTNYPIKIRSVENIDKFMEKGNIVLLGIFAQPVSILETMFNNEVPNYYLDIILYVDIDGKEYTINLSLRGEMSKDYTSFDILGKVKVLSVEEPLDIKKAIYVPTCKLVLSIEGNKEDVYFFVKAKGLSKNFLANVSTFGENKYYPKGVLHLALPNEILKGYFIHNEDSDDFINKESPLYDALEFKTLVRMYFDDKELEDLGFDMDDEYEDYY